jgi:ribonucleoside-diphosphate reductase beta chain
MDLTPLVLSDKRDLFGLLQQARSAFWVEDDILYTADLPDWEGMSADERHFIELILGFFAMSDRLVLKNLIENFLTEVTVPEARMFYNFQAAVEDVHSLTYTNHLLTLVKDPVRIEQLLHSIDHFDSVRKKAEWALKWMDRSRPFEQRLIAFAVVEAVYFSASFCSIFWFKEQNKLVKGIGLSNEYISRDEGLHAEFACTFYRNYFQPVADEVIHEIIRDAVEVECQFVDEALPTSFVGMNAELMKRYVKFVANRLALQLGCEHPTWTDVVNPFPFMERMSLNGKDNFFEKRVSTYSKANLSELDLNASEVDDF